MLNYKGSICRLENNQEETVTEHKRINTRDDIPCDTLTVDISEDCHLKEVSNVLLADHSVGH